MRTKLTIITCALLLAALLPAPASAQFKPGQRFVQIGFVADCSTFELRRGYMNYNSLGRDFEGMATTTSGSYSANLYFGLARVKTQNLMVSDYAGFSTIGSSHQEKYIDSSAMVQYKYSSENLNYSMYIGHDFSWLFPVKDKWGLILGEKNEIIYAFQQNTSRTDTFGLVYNDYYYRPESSIALNISLGLSTYYWLSPRVVISTGLTLLSGGIKANFLSTGTSTWTPPYKDSYEQYSVSLASPLSSNRRLSSYLAFGVRYLLN